MFNVKLISLISLLTLAHKVPSTLPASITEDCYDRICEFAGTSVSCYLKNGHNVCDQLNGRPICRENIGSLFAFIILRDVSVQYFQAGYISVKPVLVGQRVTRKEGMTIGY